jgi:hypothetical protein
VPELDLGRDPGDVVTDDHDATMEDARTDLLARWADELAVMRAIEQRGIAVVTTSGALLTLLVGTAALFLGGDPEAWPPLTGLASIAAGATLVLFALAAVTAIGTNIAEPLNGDDLASLKARYLGTDRARASRAIMARRVELLDVVIKKNNRKASWLSRAVALESLAVVALAATLLLARLKL